MSPKGRGPRRGATKRWSWALALLALGAVVLGVFIVLSDRRQPRPGGADCRQVPTEFTQAYAAKIRPRLDVSLGVRQELIREYESIQQDFALQYETICRDYQMGAIAGDEYNCRRAQAERALNAQRQLVTILDGQAAPATVGDSARHYVPQIIAYMQQTLAVECRPISLDVVPDTVHLTIPQGGIGNLIVTNMGPGRMHWSTKGFPTNRLYMNKMAGESLGPDAFSTADIVATAQTIAGQYDFWVRNNKRDSAYIVIVVRSVGDTGGESLRQISRLLALPDSAALATASRIVDTAELASEPARLVAASALLSRVGRFGAAELALDSLVKRDPEVSKAAWYTASKEKALDARNQGAIVGPLMTPDQVTALPWERVDSVVFTELNTGQRRRASIRTDGWFAVDSLPKGTYRGYLWSHTGGDTSKPVSTRLKPWGAPSTGGIVLDGEITKYALPVTPLAR
jgi:hypothetical protein